MTTMQHDGQSAIDPEEWARRKEFVGFTDRDAKLLKEIGPQAKKYVDEIIEELYRRFLSFEETKAFFASKDTLIRVKALQKAYFIELTEGEYGDEYLASRVRIGEVHSRIGLAPRWYMGAYSVYLQLAVPHVLSAFGSNAKKGQDALLALIKIIKLDEELAITNYTVSGEAKLAAAQAQEILEVSIPAIQIWPGIIVSPLIGTLDTGRAQMFMEKLLETIVATNSPVALVDLTGVPVLDTQTAQHLMETISAAGMLGAKVVLTGVRPAIAQTLVHLGVDMTGIITRASLAAGLRYAFGLLELKVVSKNGNQ